MFGRLLHGGNGLAAGVGGTAWAGARMADMENGGNRAMRTNSRPDGERVGFVGGQAEELRRMASVLLERLAEVGREAVVLEEETARDDGTTGKLAAAQHTLAELHGLGPKAFEQAAMFAGMLLRVAQEGTRHSSAVLGERNGASKLTEAAVRSIRRRHPNESMEALAREYGVCRDTIKDVVRFRTWQQVGRDDRERRETR